MPAGRGRKRRGRAHTAPQEPDRLPRNRPGVPSAPDQLTLERHRELAGRQRWPWSRRVLLGLLVLTLVLGLLNVFGQRPDTLQAASRAASLEVYAPTRLRSGLFYEARFTLEALRDVRNATLVLDPGWLEGMTLNTLAPSPVGEASRDGRLALELGHVPAGRKHVFFLHFQVNPTNIGRRSQRVELFDGETRLFGLERTVTIWP